MKQISSHFFFFFCAKFDVEMNEKIDSIHMQDRGRMIEISG